MIFSPRIPALLCLLLCCTAISACAGKEEKPVDKLDLAPVTFDALPGWRESATFSGALAAFRRSCGKFSELPETAPVRTDSGIDAGTMRDWRAVCDDAENVQAGEEREFFERDFAPFRVTNNGNPEGRFTGYYEIELKGSRKRSTAYPWPLYKLPPNLEGYQGRPFFSRAEIDHGALRGQGLELLYAGDPVALYFLHIQGSGRIRLEDGSLVRIGYAGKNGHPYVSIGAALADRGELVLEDITAPSLKHWLYTHPDELEETLEQNPSYVFFRALEGEGPFGGQDVALTPEHSLAVDTRYIPYGVPLWLDTTLPSASEDAAIRHYQRLMVAQDKGGAIKGIVRGDVFFGHGKRAETLAGDMKQPGGYYALLPRGIQQ